MKTAMLREKNQITIPAEVVEAAGLKVGNIIEFDASGHWRKLEPVKEAEVFQDDELDPVTFLPLKGNIIGASIVDAVKRGRERS
jgi:bifunctional DNA-binding transcriptional regulator/antitoxin component of YhaV-PrlF toxin-antitoxin module